MEEYLKNDVMCLDGLVEKMGSHMWINYGADIRVKCTIGSIAEHIWTHTLLKPIPKLCTERQHERWQRCNRGGFCGPLMGFDTRAPKGWTMYKVDITSLYPAAAKYIEFMTTLGKQAPIENITRASLHQ